MATLRPLKETAQVQAAMETALGKPREPTLPQLPEASLARREETVSVIGAALRLITGAAQPLGNIPKVGE